VRVPRRYRPLAEALAVFGGATLVIVLLFVVARFVSVVNNFLHVLVALVFLYVPVAVAMRTGHDLRDWGFTARPLGKSLALAGAAFALVFPAFLAGFVLYYQVGCGHAPGGWEELLWPTGVCRRFVGWSGLASPRGPTDPWAAAFSQLVVVALPEELFFRGYLHRRLEEVWKPRFRFLGGGLGLALVVSSALFAVAHIVVELSPARIAVFFPGLLFGWLRSATGSILAPTLVHAGSNLFIEALHRTFIR
jgi:membrane protease YdiL (CAAX protease family)